MKSIWPRVSELFHAEHSPYQNMAFLLIGQYGSKFAAFVFFAFVARIAGDDVLGQYALASTYSIFAFLAVGFGLDKLIARQVAADFRGVRQTVVNAVALQLLIWGVVVALTFWIPPKLLHFDAQTSTATLILTIWVILTAIKASIDGTFNGYETLQYTGILNFVSGFTLLGVGSVCVLVHPTVVSLAVSMVVERSITFGLAVWLWNKVTREKFDAQVESRGNVEIRVDEIKRLGRLAMPFAFFGLTASMFQRIDVLVLSMFVSKAQIGQYALAYKVLDLLVLIPGMLGVSFFPSIVRTIKNDTSQYRRIAGIAMQRGLVVMFPIVVLVFASARRFMPLVFGDEFQLSGMLLQILVWGILLQVMNNMLGRSIMAYTERSLILLGLLALGSNILLNLWLVPRIGVFGAAWATLLSYGVSTLVHVLILAKHNLSPSYSYVALSVLPLLGAGGVFWISITAGYVVAVTVSLMVYVALSLRLLTRVS